MCPTCAGAARRAVAPPPPAASLPRHCSHRSARSRCRASRATRRSVADREPPRAAASLGPGISLGRRLGVVSATGERALTCRAPRAQLAGVLYVLDEPTDGLDAITTSAVLPDCARRRARQQRRRRRARSSSARSHPSSTRTRRRPGRWSDRFRGGKAPALPKPRRRPDAAFARRTRPRIARGSPRAHFDAAHTFEEPARNESVVGLGITWWADSRFRKDRVRFVAHAPVATGHVCSGFGNAPRPVRHERVATAAASQAACAPARGTRRIAASGPRTSPSIAPAVVAGLQGRGLRRDRTRGSLGSGPVRVCGGKRSGAARNVLGVNAAEILR
jgi:hypothetical protein